MGMLLFMGEIPEGDFKLKVSTDNKNIIIKGGNETHSKSVNGVGYIRGNKAFIVVVIYGSALSNGDSVAQQIVNSLR